MSGRRRWSRSVANRTTSAATYDAHDHELRRVGPESRHRAAEGDAAEGHHERRPPVDRPDRSRPRAPASARRGDRTEAPDEPDAGREQHDRISHDDARPRGRGSVEVSGDQDFAPASASSTSVACATPGGPAGRERRDLAEVARARDVEVDPRLRHELARNSALFTSPPSLFREKLTMSPYQLSMSARYSLTSGSCQ